MSDKISVIIPVYNIEKYIENTVKSVLAQTYQNLEVVIVDDGSSDKTPEIISLLSQEDSRIRVIRKENGGVTSARIAGIRAASGDWIGFADGDDFMDCDMYERLMSNAKRYDAEISHCGYQMIFPDRVEKYYGTGNLVIQDNISGLRNLITGDFVEPGLWNKLYHRSLFQELICKDVMDISVRINEDLLMNYYLFKASERSVYEDFCSYHYIKRINSASTCGINRYQLRDPLKVLSIIAKGTQKMPEINILVRKRIVYFLCGQATKSLKADPELIRPYRDRARKELLCRLPWILKGDFGVKLKLFALWVSISPTTYSMVHIVYARLKGTYNKYEIRQNGTDGKGKINE